MVVVEKGRSSVDRRVLEEDRHVGGIRKRNTNHDDNRPKGVKMIDCPLLEDERRQQLI